MEVSKVNFGVVNTLPNKKSKTVSYFTAMDGKADSFVKQDGSNDNRFTVKEALKNFGKGIISPIKSLINHPFASLGMIAGVATLCFAVPALAPIMTLGFGALSLYEVGKGTYNAVKEYKNGNYDNSERAFEKIGTGVVGTVLTVLGLKSSAKSAVNIVDSHKAGRPLSALEQLKNAERVDKNGLLSALKDNLKIFSKDGFGAIAESLKPRNIIARFTGLINKVKTNTTLSPEELDRRANLTSEDIGCEVNSILDKTFDEMGIPKEVRPNVNIIEDAKNINRHGMYEPRNHTITVNASAYRKGSIVSLEETVAHEALHSKMSIYRSSLSQEETSQAVKELLRDRILNGEPEKIIKEGSLLGNVMMDAPKMTPKMRQDFLKYADEFIFAEGDLSQSTNKFAQLLDNNPEFITANGGTYNEAWKILEDYVLSHESRYKAFSRVRTNNFEPIKLNPEQREIAIESLKEYIATAEGNSRTSNLFANVFGVSKDAFNQYQFSPEEILARDTAANFEKAKITALLEDASLSSAKRLEYTQRLQDLDFVLEYNKVGKAYYELYTKVLNNPQDAQLVNELKVLQNTLHKMDHIKEIGNIALQTKGVLPVNSVVFFPNKD